MEICTFIDLAEFICEMAENIHTFGGSPIFIYGHPGGFLPNDHLSIIFLYQICKSHLSRADRAYHCHQLTRPAQHFM